MHSVTSESDYEMIRYVQQKLIFERITPAKPMSEILQRLLQELNQLKSEFIGEIDLCFHSRENSFDIQMNRRILLILVNSIQK